MQDAQAPPQVQEAFYDAVKAREDEVRLRNEAEAYRNDILPKARGDADAMREQAEGYRRRVQSLAEGEAKRFLSVLAEYRKAPEVTRQRLYLDTMESVLGSASKVLMDAPGSSNLMYLPLDRLLAPRAAEEGAEPTAEPRAATAPREEVRRAIRDDGRRSR
jgi:membrane protease subunit HflK